MTATFNVQTGSGDPPATTTTGAQQPSSPQPPSTPSAPAKLPRIAATGVISLPSTKRCVRSRRFSVRVSVPAGLTGRRATVVVRGRQIKVVSGKDLGRSFVARTPRSGPFTAKVTLTLADGRAVSASGRYRACAARR